MVCDDCPVDYSSIVLDSLGGLVDLATSPISYFFGFDSSEECLACSFLESCVGTTPPDAEPMEEALLPPLDRVVRGASWRGGCVCMEGMLWTVDDSVGMGETREGGA